MPAKEIIPEAETCLTCMQNPCACDNAKSASDYTSTTDTLRHVVVSVGTKEINVWVDPSHVTRKVRRQMRSAQEQDEEAFESLLYSLLSRLIVRWDMVDAFNRPVLTCARIPTGTQEYADERECLEDVPDAVVAAVWEGIQGALNPNQTASAG